MKNQLSAYPHNRIENSILDEASTLFPDTSPRVGDLDELPSPRISDDNLVRLWIDGRPGERQQALRELLERHEPAAFLICQILVENEEDAKLACEDACVEAITLMQWESPDGITSFRVELFRAVRCRCELFTPLTTPAANADLRNYRSLVGNLPEAERWMLALRFFAGLSKAEIAAILSVPETDVKTGLWTAMQRILQRGFTGETGYRPLTKAPSTREKTSPHPLPQVPHQAVSLPRTITPCQKALS